MSLLTIGPWFVSALLLMAALGALSQWRGSKWTADRTTASRPLPGPPRRGHYVLLLACFAVFALYGSLVPFEFASVQFTDALHRFGRLWHLNIVIESRSDWVANVLLAIPFGFCGLAILNVDRPGRARALWQAALVIPCCACYSSFLEFSQIWLPARDSSQNDIAAQTLGAILGAGVWIVAGQWLTHWARGFFAAHGPRQQIERLLQAYCAILLLYSILPLDLTISPIEIYHKWRAGQILLAPFPYHELSAQRITENMGNALLFATVGMLAASRPTSAATQRPVLHALQWGFCLSAGIEVAQLFVVSRYTKTSDVIIGTSAAALGGWALRWATSRSETGVRGAAADRTHAWRWYGLAVLYSLALTVVFTAPFQWLNDPVRVAKRWRNLWNIPFVYSKYWSDPLDALEDVLFKLLLFCSLGALLARGIAAQWSSPVRRRKLQLAALAICAAVATMIELLQVHFPPHVADLTDVFIATAGAWVGVMAVAHVTKPTASVTSTIAESSSGSTV